MKKLFVLFSLILISFGNAQAQGWEKTFPFGPTTHSVKIFELDDGNFIYQIFSGSGINDQGFGDYLMKMDANGDGIWMKKLPTVTSSGSQIQECPDGSFIFYHSNFVFSGFKTPTIWKIDEAGEVVWEQNPIDAGDVEDDTFVNKLIINDDGNYIFFAFESDTTNRFLFKMDDLGNTIWIVQPEWINQVGLPIYMKSRSDNDGLLFQRFDDNVRVVYETDEMGNYIDSTVYPIDQLIDGFEMDNGDFVRFNDNYFYRFDANDNLLIETEIWPSTTFGGKAKQTTDGFIIVGQSEVLQNPNTNSSIHLVKTDFNGNVIWAKSHNEQNGIGEESWGSFDLCADGSIIVAGEVFEPGGIGTYVFKTDANGDIWSNAITGHIAIDQNGDCMLGEEDLPLDNWLVVASNDDQTFSGTSDDGGNYFIPADVGEYTVTVFPPATTWLPCDNEFEVVFDDVYSQEIIDFSITVGEECSHMSVNGNALNLRPCFERPYYVNYCNYGTVLAEDAYLEIHFDPFITPMSSTLPWVSQSSDNVYTFELGDVAPLECGSFEVALFLDCDAEVGLGYCIDIHAFPDTLCTPPSGLWSGAFLEVSGECEGDNINFKIENIGAGDMNESSEYIIVEDAVLMFMDFTQLDSDESVDIPLIANGSTYTIIAEQVAFAPGNSMPMAVIEGCGENESGTFSINFINQFQFDDLSPYFDEDCPVAISSYDPNSKEGYPIGYGAEQFIEPGTKIEYIINFQNTGTDTAYLVILKDELDENLDISTFQIGTSSHEFEYKIEGRLLEFTFLDIDLLDSTSNVEASQGFVEFSINAAGDAPIGSVINNEAAIYFDFNPPIITNETKHTIGLDFIEILVGNSDEPNQFNSKVTVQPNPFKQHALLQIHDVEQQMFRLEIFDVSGKLIQSQSQNDVNFEIHRSTFVQGIYFYEITGDRGFVNSGKIIVK